VEYDPTGIHLLNIRGAVDPVTGRTLSLLEAIDDGMITPAVGHFIHPATGEIVSIERAIQLGWVVTDKESSQPSGTLADSHRRSHVIGLVKVKTYVELYFQKVLF